MNQFDGLAMVIKPTPENFAQPSIIKGEYMISNKCVSSKCGGGSGHVEGPVEAVVGAQLGQVRR